MCWEERNSTNLMIFSNIVFYDVNWYEESKSFFYFHYVYLILFLRDQPIQIKISTFKGRSFLRQNKVDFENLPRCL